MKMMSQLTEPPKAVRSVIRCSTRFATLWCFLFVLIMLMALIEGAVLWNAGFRYRPQTSVSAVSVVDLSVSTDGDTGVSTIRFRRRLMNERNRDAVVLHNLSAQTAVVLDMGLLEPQCVALSPTRGTVAVACTDDAIYTLDLASADSTSNKDLRLFSRVAVTSFVQVAFSPNGQLLAAAGERSWYLWKWPDGKLICESSHGGGAAKSLSFSADSRRMITNGRSAELRLWNTLTGELIRTVTLGESIMVSATLSPDGRTCALVTDGKELHLYDLEKGRSIWKSRCDQLAVAFSPDGCLLATASNLNEDETGRVNFFDTQSGHQTHSLTGHDSTIRGICFPSNSILYSWDSSGEIRAWNTVEMREQWCLSMLDWASREDYFAQLPLQITEFHGGTE